MIKKRSGSFYLKNFHKHIILILLFLTSVACVSQKVKIETIYSKAENLYKTGHVEKAISYYKSVISKAEKSKDLSPFLRSYYKILSYYRIGEIDKALKETEDIPFPSSFYTDNYLLLKAIYFNELGLNLISKEISENLLYTKNDDILEEAILLFSKNIIKLHNSKNLIEKEFLSSIKKIKGVLKKHFTSPIIHYSLFSLYLNNKNYKEALDEAVLSLELGIKGTLKRDLLFSIKYISSKLDESILKNYERILRRYNVTND